MAGFWAGFGEQLSDDIARRQKTLDRLIEENLDNARTAKQSYATRKGQAAQVVKSAQAIQAQFGINTAEAVALAESYGTDLPKLQDILETKDAQLKSDLGVGYNASDVMSYVNAAQNLTLPEGMTLQQGVERLMGLNAMELSKEADPKSEGARVRSFIRSAMAFDPQLSAAEQMQNIKGPDGLSYAQLLEMQEAGFAPEDVIGDVTRASGPLYDYTANTAKATRNDYSRRLSIKVFDTDLTDVDLFNTYITQQGPDKQQLRSTAYSAGEALAKLERAMVLQFRGTDLSLNAFRKGVLDDLYGAVETYEDMENLISSINSGEALRIIDKKQGVLTDEDYNTILGTPLEVDPDSLEEPDPLPTPEPDTPVVETPQEVDPEVQRMLDDLGGNAEPDAAPEVTTDAEEEVTATDVDTSPRTVAARNEQSKESLRKNMAKVTRDEWEDMSRKEREEAGLPVRNLDLWFSGADAFKDAEE
jgi:hypothetical protein